MSLCDTCKNKPDCSFTELGEFAEYCNYFIAVNVGTVGHIDWAEPSIPVKDLEKLVAEWRETAPYCETVDDASALCDCADQLNELIKEVKV